MSVLGTREQRSLTFLILTFLALWLFGTMAWLRAEPSISQLEALYRSLQMFSLNFTEPAHGVPRLLEIARFAQPGFTVLAFAAAVSAQLRLVLRAILNRRADQITIIGYGVSGKAAGERFRSRQPDARIVALDHSVTAADARAARRNGVELIECDVLDSEARRSFAVGLKRSCELIIACGADQTNLSLLDELSSEFACAVAPARIWLHLSSHRLAERLRESYWHAAASDPIIEFVEVADHAAQAVLLSHPLVLEARAAGLKRVHVVIHGFDDFGWLCAEQVLINGFFPAPTFARPKVSILAQDATAAETAWLARHSGLGDQFDVSFYAAPAGATCWIDENDRLYRAIEATPPSLHVFAGENSEMALTDALALRDAMRRGARSIAPIVVRSDHRRLTGRDLTEASAVIQHRLTIVDGYDTPASVFGIVGRIIQDRARSFHDAYRRRSDAPPFERLPHSQRLSNRRAAYHLLEKLRILGFEDAYPDKPAYRLSKSGLAWLRELPAQELDDLDQLENRRWRSDRLIEGWRAGPRDSERRLRDGLRGDLAMTPKIEAQEQAKDRSQLEDFFTSETGDQDQTAAMRVHEETWEEAWPEWVFNGELSLHWPSGVTPQLAESAGCVTRLRVPIPPVPNLGWNADRTALSVRKALLNFSRAVLATSPQVRLRLVRAAAPPWNWLPSIPDTAIDAVTLPRFVVGFTGHRDVSRLGDVSALRERLRHELKRIVPAGTLLITGLAKGADTMMVELWSELQLGPITGIVPHLDQRGAATSEHSDDIIQANILKLCSKVLPADAYDSAAADDRHRAVGAAILDSATLLIAVSDGVNGGRGGVEDIVASARSRKMLVRYVRV